MYDCCLCKEIETGYLDLGQSKHYSTTLCQNARFCILPSLGAIVEGHLLIIPREHYVSIGAMPEDYIIELNVLKEKVHKIMHEVYGPVIYFEHGPAKPGEIAGCCIDHAHLHCIPLTVDILPKLFLKFKSNEINNILYLKTVHENNQSYLYYENQMQKKYVFLVQDNLESQYMRRLIADAVGQSYRWNWREYNGISNINNTIIRLQDQLNGL